MILQIVVVVEMDIGVDLTQIQDRQNQSQLLPLA